MTLERLFNYLLDNGWRVYELEERNKVHDYALIFRHVALESYDALKLLFGYAPPVLQIFENRLTIGEPKLEIPLDEIEMTEKGLKYPAKEMKILEV